MRFMSYYMFILFFRSDNTLVLNSRVSSLFEIYSSSCVEDSLSPITQMALITVEMLIRRFSLCDEQHLKFKFWTDKLMLRLVDFDCNSFRYVSLHWGFTSNLADNSNITSSSELNFQSFIPPIHREYVSRFICDDITSDLLSSQFS